MSDSSKFCIESEPGDSKYFGSFYYGKGVAINERYVAVTDQGNNRVVIYQKNIQDIWQRTREIYPPHNSIHSKLGHSFSDDLDLKLSQHGLIIKTYSSQQYYVELDKREEPFLLPIKEKKNLFQFYDLYEGRLRRITLNTKNRIIDKRHITIYKNLILIGLPSRRTCGKGLLFDLEASDKSSVELKADNAYVGDTVAISEEFAVVGNSSSSLSSLSNQDSTCLAKTLIVSLKNGSSFVLNSTGYVSLYKNILAVMRPQSKRVIQSAKLSLYFINKDASPRLIMQKSDVGKAWVENNWLITFKKSDVTLEQDSLIIHVGTVQRTKDVVNPNEFTFNGGFNSLFLGKYFIQLDKKEGLTSLDFSIEDNLKKFYILERGKPRLIALSKNNEESFGESISNYNNLLLVGSPSRKTGGKGFLFNLNALNKAPLELKTESNNSHIGDTVFLSDKFAVVASTIKGTFSDPSYYPKILIKSLDNNSAFLFDVKGHYPFLYKDILIIYTPISARFEDSGKLKFYHLDKNATPHFILERKIQDQCGITVKNGWLVTLEILKYKLKLKLCLEPIKEIIDK